uniref:Uncharacterized protein n=1 Tax=Anopheles culicifacies TaxID=139723 RepID=A0A182MLM0_9DIPT
MAASSDPSQAHYREKKMNSRPPSVWTSDDVADVMHRVMTADRVGRISFRIGTCIVGDYLGSCFHFGFASPRPLAFTMSKRRTAKLIENVPLYVDQLSIDALVV